MKSKSPSRRKRQTRHNRVTSPVTTGPTDCDNVTDVTGGETVCSVREAESKYLPRIRVRETDKGTSVEMGPTQHRDMGDAYKKAFGSSDSDFIEGLIRQLYRAGLMKDGEAEKGPNFMLSIIQGMKPEDQVEAMLGAQMAATHMATMSLARRLNNVDTLVQQDSAQRAFNKLARTFTTQIDTLKRYRNGGEQKVTVEHVTVNDGGQAIVGSISHAGGGDGREK